MPTGSTHALVAVGACFGGAVRGYARHPVKLAALCCLCDLLFKWFHFPVNFPTTFPSTPRFPATFPVAFLHLRCNLCNLWIIPQLQLLLRQPVEFGARQDFQQLPAEVEALLDAAVFVLALRH